MSDGRLPFVILGGFLGAGKSTWLRHQLHEGAFAGWHILVNEAAETPVDNLLLHQAHRLVTLAGGCACCTGAAALISALRAICSARDAGEPVGGILLETSGLADPGAIAAALAADPVLGRRLRLREALVLVDARHGLEQLMQEPLARAQAEAADRVILTKLSAAEPDGLGALRATLSAINPAAPQEGADYGVPLGLPPLGKGGGVALAPLPLDEAPIMPCRLQIGEEGGWVALSTWLSALLSARGRDIVRVKGVVRSPAGLLLLQAVRETVQPPEILPDPNDAPASAARPEVGHIVLIGRNLDPERLRRSWARFGA